MKILKVSNKINILQHSNQSKIYLLYQYFQPSDKLRFKEIIYCLKKNIENPFVEKIFLLNEKIYSKKELGGLSSDKICQIDVKDRLTFKMAFEFVEENKEKFPGFYCIMNSDIFFDNSIEKLKHTNLHETKSFMSLLRWEYNPKNIANSKLFGPRFDSQDTWIIHSNQNISEQMRKTLNFQFGKPGCDNKLIYLFYIFGYEVYNDPLCIKSYHVHSSKERSYTFKDSVLPPWGMISPYGVKFDKLVNTLGYDVKYCANKTENFSKINFEDNNKLHDYICTKLSHNENFYIPSISNIESNFAVFIEFLKKEPQNAFLQKQVIQYFNNHIIPLKNITGIMFKNIQEIMQYSTLYLSSFHGCTMYSMWEPNTEVYRMTLQSHDHIASMCKEAEPISNCVFDVFHYLNYPKVWTEALMNKKLLIVSPYANEIESNLSQREKVYGRDLFPYCSFVCITTPDAQNDGMKQDHAQVVQHFYKNCVKEQEYDVALINWEGYGNMLCKEIYGSGKSAIYISRVLQMYFGVYDTTWMKERPDIFKMYLNDGWNRIVKN